MKVLVTGAAGFVGSWLVPRFVECGHEIVAAVYSKDEKQTPSGAPWLTQATKIVDIDLLDQASVTALVKDVRVDAVLHLAAVASGLESRHDPARAWEINVVGTVRLAESFAGTDPKPLFMLASTGEVYGWLGGETIADESCATRPISPYAASKLAAEIAIREIGNRRNLPFMIVRPFNHSGARQDGRFVLPAFARRVIDGKKMRAAAVPVGNLETVRDFLHVSDVVEAYRLLLERGEQGETYNIASGEGTSLRDLFFMVVDAADSRVIPEIDSAYMRTADIPFLVGNATKLRTKTGWKPKVSVPEIVAEVVNASAA